MYMEAVFVKDYIDVPGSSFLIDMEYAGTHIYCSRLVDGPTKFNERSEAEEFLENLGSNPRVFLPVDDPSQACLNTDFPWGLNILAWVCVLVSVLAFLALLVKLILLIPVEENKV